LYWPIREMESRPITFYYNNIATMYIFINEKKIYRKTSEDLINYSVGTLFLAMLCNGCWISFPFWSNLLTVIDFSTDKSIFLSYSLSFFLYFGLIDRTRTSRPQFLKFGTMNVHYIIENRSVKTNKYIKQNYRYLL